MNLLPIIDLGRGWTLCANEDDQPLVISPKGSNVERVTGDDEIMCRLAHEKGWYATLEKWLELHSHDKTRESAAAVLAAIRWSGTINYSGR